MVGCRTKVRNKSSILDFKVIEWGVYLDEIQAFPELGFIQGGRYHLHIEYCKDAALEDVNFVRAIKLVSYFVVQESRYSF